jgi:hypothetical protein
MHLCKAFCREKVAISLLADIKLSLFGPFHNKSIGKNLEVKNRMSPNKFSNFSYLSNAGVQSDNQHFEGQGHLECIVDKVAVHKCCAEGYHNYQKQR